MDRNKSPAHILMSHGGTQHHSNPHNTFKPKRRAYATGGYATGGDTYDTGGETIRRDAKVERPYFAGGNSYEEGGCVPRRKRPVNINPHTGHSQYFLPFLPLIGSALAGFLGSKLLGGGSQPQPQAQRRGGRSRARYAEGGYANGGDAALRKDLFKKYRPQPSFADGNGKSMPRYLDEKGKSVPTDGNGKPVGLRRGGRRHHSEGRSAYSKGGYAEGGEMIPIEGKARANFHGGPQFSRAALGGNRPFAEGGKTYE